LGSILGSSPPASTPRSSLAHSTNALPRNATGKVHKPTLRQMFADVPLYALRLTRASKQWSEIIFTELFIKTWR
jgi:hypothetical protein